MSVRIRVRGLMGTGPHVAIHPVARTGGPRKNATAGWPEDLPSSAAEPVSAAAQNEQQNQNDDDDGRRIHILASLFSLSEKKRMVRNLFPTILRSRKVFR